MGGNKREAIEGGPGAGSDEEEEEDVEHPEISLRAHLAASCL